jgi:hypothetical protein
VVAVELLGCLIPLRGTYARNGAVMSRILPPSHRGNCHPKVVLRTPLSPQRHQQLAKRTFRSGEKYLSCGAVTY